MAKMVMQTEKLFASGKPARARVQNLANFEAVHGCLSNKGHWREAWQYTYLGEFGATASGTTLSERMAIGKMLKGSFALEELLTKEDQRKKE